jgi:hypothetical protein
MLSTWQPSWGSQLHTTWTPPVAAHIGLVVLRTTAAVLAVTLVLVLIALAVQGGSPTELGAPAPGLDL